MINLDRVKAFFTVARAYEIGASLFTLVGMWLGTTNVPGIVLYLIATGFWFALSYEKKLWGIMPLNFAALGVLSGNLLRAIQ